MYRQGATNAIFLGTAKAITVNHDKAGNHSSSVGTRLIASVIYQRVFTAKSTGDLKQKRRNQQRKAQVL
jgi:hypothetical protein